MDELDDLSRLSSAIVPGSTPRRRLAQTGAMSAGGGTGKRHRWRGPSSATTESWPSKPRIAAETTGMRKRTEAAIQQVTGEGSCRVSSTTMS